MNRWLQRKRPEEHETLTDPAPHGTELSEAQAARRISEEGLRHAQARDPSVREAGRSLRALRTQNGFAADWRAAMLRKGI